MSEHPASWHLDPAGSGRLRWWDGYQWTDHFQDPSTGSPASSATGAAISGIASKAGQMMKDHAERKASEKAAQEAVEAGNGATLWEAKGKPLSGFGAGRYRLTSEYLYFEKGTLSTNAQQVPVAELYDVDGTQTMGQKARGVGTISLSIRRPDGSETVRLEDIPHFREGVQAINAAARAERERLEVRANTQTVNYAGHHPMATMPAAAQVAVPVVAAPASASANDLMATLEQLGKLRDAGVVTSEEFEAKKAELLARI